MTSEMFKYCHFDFEPPSARFSALDSLRVEIPLPSTKIKTEHLDPLIYASDHSTGRMGRLTERDKEKMRDLGECTHNKLLVLLLEPTQESEDTIECIDRFLKWASLGSLNRSNTAIINCRALVPNASYRPSYNDSSPYV